MGRGCSSGRGGRQARDGRTRDVTIAGMSHSPSLSLPDDLLRRLAAARSVVAFTGAGVSKESGLDTFRDADGVWQKVRPEDMATPQAFRRDPARVGRWYGERVERAP